MATRLERRLVSPGPIRSERETLRRVRTTRDRLIVGLSLGGLALLLGLPLAVLVERSLAAGDGYGLDSYRALGRPTSVLLVAPWEAVVNSIVYARRCDRHRRDRRRARRVRVADTRGSRLLDGLVLLPLGVSAVTLGFGFLIAFDTRSARLPGRAVDRADRAGARRDPVRRADRGPDAAIDRPTPTRGRSPARRVARARAEGDRPADRLARTRRRCRLRVRDLARRVRRDRVPRAARTVRRCPSRSSGSWDGRASRTSRRPMPSRSCSWP